MKAMTLWAVDGSMVVIAFFAGIIILRHDERPDVDPKLDLLDLALQGYCAGVLRHEEKVVAREKMGEEVDYSHPEELQPSRAHI